MMEPTQTFSPIDEAYSSFDLWLAGMCLYIYKSPHLRELVGYLPEDFKPRTRDDYKAFFRRLWQLSSVYDRITELMITGVREYTTQCLYLPSYPEIKDAVWQNRIAELNEQGYTFLDPLPENQVLAMREYFERTGVVSGYDKPQVSLQEHDRDQLGLYPINDILKCPHLLEFGCQPEVMSLIQAYLGVIPAVNVVGAWWSFAERKKARDAQLFHLDFDDFKFCKLFLYLTDVDENSGPHIYVPGTHTNQKAYDLAKRQNLYNDDFRLWFAKEMRKSDEDVKRYLGVEPVVLTGKAGSCFIVDTRGIHKGLLPKNKDRLVAQFQYGFTPMPQLEMNPLTVGEPGTEVFPKNITELPCAYTHRMFVQSGQTRAINYRYWK